MLNARFLAATLATGLSLVLMVQLVSRFIAFLGGNRDGTIDLWLIMIGMYFIVVIAGDLIRARERES